MKCLFTVETRLRLSADMARHCNGNVLCMTKIPDLGTRPTSRNAVRAHEPKDKK